MVDSDRDVFVTRFRQSPVQCDSAADVIALRSAESALANGELFTPAELDRLAEALRRYAYQSEAEHLAHRATRHRAAQFLKDSVGYERPGDRMV